MVTVNRKSDWKYSNLKLVKVDVHDATHDAVVNPVVQWTAVSGKNKIELCGGAQLKIWHHKTNILVIHSQW